MFVTTNRLVTALFVSLLTGAAFFSLERVLFADASFILFRLLNQESLQIQEHRYGAFLTQGLALLGAKLHLPLPVIVVVYSASFTLFYLVVAWLLLYRFRQPALAVLFAFYQLLFVSDTWFWMNNEVHQGMAWLVLFFALVLVMGKKKTPWLLMLPVFLLLAFLTLYTHPLLAFPTAFLWLFFSTGKEWPYSRQRTVFLSLFLLAIAFSKFNLSSGASSHYDVEKLQHLLHPTLDKMVNSVQSPLAKELLHRLGWNYWLIPLLLLSGLFAALRQKAYRVVLLVTSFTPLYFLALCLTFSDFLPFYTESELMPATIILTTPFVFYVLPRLRPGQMVLILALIFGIRLAYIGAAAPRWIVRKEWLLATVERMEEKNVSKALVPETEANRQLLFTTWGTPVESFLASAWRGERPQRTFVVDKAERLAERRPADRATMVSSFEWLSPSAFNPVYFRPDTTGFYQLLALPETVFPLKP